MPKPSEKDVLSTTRCFMRWNSPSRGQLKSNPIDALENEDLDLTPYGPSIKGNCYSYRLDYGCFHALR